MIARIERPDVRDDIELKYRGEQVTVRLVPIEKSTEQESEVPASTAVLRVDQVVVAKAWQQSQNFHQPVGLLLQEICSVIQGGTCALSTDPFPQGYLHRQF